MQTKEQLIKQLDLKPHPEGGFFKETYRSEHQVSFTALPENFHSPRNLASSIYFLLGAGDVSRLHRLKSDEIWYFHKGSSIILHTFTQDKTYLKYILGEGGVYQVVIPSGTIFGAEARDKTGYALLGCMVTPGFDFDDFELVDKEEMVKLYPEKLELIKRFT
jgi:hypothetical protein